MVSAAITVKGATIINYWAIKDIVHMQSSHHTRMEPYIHQVCRLVLMANILNDSMEE